jgi:hypothetical protein
MSNGYGEYRQLVTSTTYLYRVLHLPTQAVYYGVSANPTRRWADHRTTYRWDKDTTLSAHMRANDGPADYRFAVLMALPDRSTALDFEAGCVARAMRTGRAINKCLHGKPTPALD